MLSMANFVILATFIVGAFIGFGIGQAIGRAEAEVKVYREQFGLPNQSDDDNNSPELDNRYR